MLITCNNLQKSFGTEEILHSVSFILEDKEKAAIVGVNGAGKTSVFRLLTKEWVPDGGEIIFATGIKIGHLPQITTITSPLTLYEELDTVFEPLRVLEATIRKLESDMANQKGDVLEATMSKYSRLMSEFEEKRGYEATSRLKGVLKGLGFTESQWQQPIMSLSGGQQTRAALGKLLLSAPDVLLLDEPTNHLDISSIAWLEEYLREYKNGVLLISHDRYFLDRVTTKTIEIENKKATVYNGSYSFYAKHKAINRETALRHYLNQQKDIKRQEKIIQAYRARLTEKNYIRAKSREKLLDKMEKVDKPESLPEQMRLMLTPKIETGYDVLDVSNLSMAFGEKLLFKNASFSLKKGDKAALIGPNGIGKSTLFKIIMGQYAPPTGDIREGVHLRIGYYDQAGQNLSEEKNVFQELADTYPRLTQTEIRNVLAAFLFTGDDVFKLISQLSGGERGRVSLAKIMLGGANVLVLDEPTNHLDIFSKEILEKALSDFPGTVLFISHDRYFINSTATKILDLSIDGIVEYLGNYDYYLDKKAQVAAPSPSSVIATSATDTSNKNDWQAKKQAESAARKLENKKKRLEQSIQELENKIAACDAQLALDEIGRDAEKVTAIFTEKTVFEEELLKLYDEYM
ncbi:MAG: ABC-F family ATP-binding cassette domain-containing protein [Defluviitaleaceae bacterium]|nr:ABC-F family ATP-binding cassette domain-containing protein [Defluviitaleaceae bacterium]